MKDIIEFTISLAFNIHKITLIYTTVFFQCFERFVGGFCNDT